MNPALVFRFDLMDLDNRVLQIAATEVSSYSVISVLLMSINYSGDKTCHQGINKNSLSHQIRSHEASEPSKPAFSFDLVGCSVLCSFLLLGLEFDVLCSAYEIKSVSTSFQFMSALCGMLAGQLTSSVVPHFTVRRDLVLLRRLARQIAARVAEAALRTALHRPLIFFHQRRGLVESLHGCGRVRAGHGASA